MPNPSYSFRIASNLVLTINILIGISSIFLIERLIPMIENIVKENSYSLNASMEMVDAILGDDETGFWHAYEKANLNITMKREVEIVASIKSKAKVYWTESNAINQKSIMVLLTDLSKVNLDAIDEKDKNARFVGLSGAWALGFVTLFSFVFQLVLRNRVTSQLMEPVSDLIAVISDFQQGKKMRRFTNVDAHHEIKSAGKALNKILDQQQ